MNIKHGFIDLDFKGGWKVDAYITSAIVFFLCFSVFVVFSASDENAKLISGHVVKSVLAFAVFVFVSRVNPSYIKQLSIKVYALSIFLLLLVDLFGEVRGGSQRWLTLFGFSFQPSEIVKITVPMACALLISHLGLTLKLKDIIKPIVVIVVPSFMVLKQPDLGTSILIAFSGLVIIFFSGLPLFIIGMAIVVMAALSPMVWAWVLKPYQKERILTVFDPEKDPLGAGYHVIQSKIAIGTGGMNGSGWLEGTQTHLGFIPEQHTDFLFSAIGEEFGFIGFLILMLGYILLLARLFYIMIKAQDIYFKAFAGGVASIIFAYVFVNIGMVTGLLPVVGVPLPMMSYGGTATISLMASLGVVSSYSVQKMNS